MLSTFSFFILTGWPSHVQQKVGEICLGGKCTEPWNASFLSW